jgi:hypothetical protein
MPEKVGDRRLKNDEISERKAAAELGGGEPAIPLMG